MECRNVGSHGGALHDEQRSHLSEDDGVENRAKPNREESENAFDFFDLSNRA